MINASDITFLCLPDAASRESVSLVENDQVCIIDTSTAHRTEARNGHMDSRNYQKNIAKKIKTGKRIAVPAAMRQALFLLSIRLVANGILPKRLSGQ